MSDLQPPPGYVSTPPSEPGWYRVWNPDEGGEYWIELIELINGKLYLYRPKYAVMIEPKHANYFWNHQQIDF